MKRTCGYQETNCIPSEHQFLKISIVFYSSFNVGRILTLSVVVHCSFGHILMSRFFARHEHNSIHVLYGLLLNSLSYCEFSLVS